MEVEFLDEICITIQWLGSLFSVLHHPLLPRDYKEMLVQNTVRQTNQHARLLGLLQGGHVKRRGVEDEQSLLIPDLNMIS